MPTTSVTSTIISSLGGGSGIDMAALAQSLATAQFAARIDRNAAQSDTVDKQLSAAATLKSQFAQLVSAVGERVR
ncbi:MAG: flagellar hook protein, partial [Pseudomonadota bacterium]|nr:flagellar hook protein [Pseudomonadota bacterium]